MNTDILTEFLNTQLNCLEQLLNILDIEKLALVDRDHEKIATLAQRKESLLLKLNELDQNIGEHLAQQALPEHLHSIKDKITEQAQLCQQKNQENGRAIDLSINSLNRLQRSIIQKRSGNSMTYNAKGKTRGSGSSNGYVSA